MRRVKEAWGKRAGALALSLLLACAPVPLVALSACSSGTVQNAANAEEELAVSSFTWSGGSGRLSGMDCTRLVERGGRAYATIEFESSHYTTVRAGDDEFQNSTPGTDVSTFEIPVNLNAETQISALTTAMSEDHWVDYALFVATDANAAAADAGAGDEAASTGSAAYVSGAPDLAGLSLAGSMDLEYATQFDVYYYTEGYKVIDVHDSARYLLAPEGAAVPEGLDADITVLQQPLDHIYLCASSAMAQFFSIGADDCVKYTALDVSGWQIDAPRQALETGAMSYAGKYSAPDYEQLIASGCDLALESTMILHAPEVREMLESLGIPVFIERSSYEGEPLGRAEWVRAFGVLTNREDEAEAAFQEQKRIVESIDANESTGKTVVFFSVGRDGSVTVRRPDDYIARAIEQAGGVYAFRDLQTAEQSPSVSITMEEFYATASQADYLVYNGTIDDAPETIGDLLQKSEVFADFSAVKNGRVWTSDSAMFQSTDRIASMIEDFHTLVTDGDASQMTFLHKVG